MVKSTAEYVIGDDITAKYILTIEYIYFQKIFYTWIMTKLYLYASRIVSVAYKMFHGNFGAPWVFYLMMLLQPCTRCKKTKIRYSYRLGVPKQALSSNQSCLSTLT